MKLPEWRPLPPHLKGSDDDSKDFAASLMLLVPIALIGLSVVIFFLALLA